MYAPQYPTKGQTPTGPTQHLHAPTETLSEHEDATQYKTFIAGRTSAYDHAIANTKDWIARTKESKQRNPHDPALWALIEGQIEGLKEILHTLEKAKEELK